ncbi:hypothetical protein D3C86_1884870 [compost metagenome]
MEVAELVEAQFDLEIGVALHGVGHGQLQARRDLAHDPVEVVAVDLDEAPFLELGRRHCRLPGQVRQQADHHGQLALLDRVTDLYVI